MNEVSTIVERLLELGVNKIIGVIGGGKSFEIVESFIGKGGDFIESPTEFSAPVIAGSVNKFGSNKNFAASISIRGPGLASSLPGLYHNFLEDQKSFSISEGLDSAEMMLTHHKIFDSTNALSSVGLVKTLDLSLFKNFNLDSSGDNDYRMLHTTTGNDEIFSYIRSEDEMCSDQSMIKELGKRRKIFVIGKRGMEHSIVQKYLLARVPFFLTPAALPYADLGLPNYMGVWTGNEQFKTFDYGEKLLDSSVIVRIGVMKRELLTLRQKCFHFDLPLTHSNKYMGLEDYIDYCGLEDADGESQHFKEFRDKIAFLAGDWSAYSAISIINDLQQDYNYAIDVGSFATIVECFIRPKNKYRIHSSFVGKFMGTAAPTAIGIGLSEPTIPLLCMLGDGSFASSFNELTTIVSLNLPICIIVFSDNSMHSIINRNKANQSHTKRFFPVNHSVLVKTKIHNLPTFEINSKEAFSTALANWNRTSPTLMVLKFDPEFYARGVDLLR